MNRQKVNFRKGVIDIKDFRKVVDNLLRVFQSESTLLNKTFGGVYPNWQLAPSLIFSVGEVFDVFKLPASPCKKLYTAISFQNKICSQINVHMSSS